MDDLMVDLSVVYLASCWVVWTVARTVESRAEGRVDSSVELKADSTVDAMAVD